jgi:hypothetical protein
MKAVLLKGFGGVDQLSYEEVGRPHPADGEVRPHPRNQRKSGGLQDSQRPGCPRSPANGKDSR